MSTRAYIARELPKDWIEFVYVHLDGDPDYTGRILKRCYRTEDKVMGLIGRGDIHSLGETPARTEPLQGGEKCALVKRALFRNLLASGRIDYAYVFSRGRWVALNAALLEIPIP